MSEQGVTHKGILPGMAAIAIFMLFVGMIMGFKVMGATNIPAATRYAVAAVCSMVVVGVFGFLRLRRWGWALVLGGCIIGSMMMMLWFHATHEAGPMIEGLFLLVFFLYLVRPEVRERVR